MKQGIEVRHLAKEMRAGTNAKGERTVSGYAVVFDSPSCDLGGFTERVSPLALTRTLRDQPDVYALYAHGAPMVLGRTKAGTLNLKVDSTGLGFECSLPDTTVGRDLTTLLERGDVDGCSFGFVCVADEWNSDSEGRIVRTLLDIDLHEISITPMEAYGDTSVSLRTAPMEIRSRLDASRASGKTKTVDGEALPASSFLIVGDPEKTDTWKLPWKFADEEKTKSHLRNALARFDQLDGVSAEAKADARKRLVALCKQYGIDVTEEKSAPSVDVERLRMRLRLAQLRS